MEFSGTLTPRGTTGGEISLALSAPTLVGESPECRSIFAIAGSDIDRDYPSTPPVLDGACCSEGGVEYPDTTPRVAVFRTRHKLT